MSHRRDIFPGNTVTDSDLKAPLLLYLFSTSDYSQWIPVIDKPIPILVPEILYFALVKTSQDNLNNPADDNVQDIGAETIGAIREYHGHKKFDINE